VESDISLIVSAASAKQRQLLWSIFLKTDSLLTDAGHRKCSVVHTSAHERTSADRRSPVKLSGRFEKLENGKRLFVLDQDDDGLALDRA
jgi:hypothetical protein